VSIAYAQNKNIEAFYNDIKLMVNGKIVDTKQDTPFIYNGRTYTPARYVAEALGATVKWNETTNVVEVTSNTQTINSVVTGNLNSNTKSITVIKKDRLIISLIDNIEYLPLGRFLPYGYTIELSSDKKYYIIYEYSNLGQTKTEILNNIPYSIINDQTFIRYDFYLSKIKPLIK
jgi:hypothetical protein